MATFLFKDIIFGPVNSRRLGTSLGINLLPQNRKICNFDCIYCECGLNTQISNYSHDFPETNEVITNLENTLRIMSEKGNCPDVITFSGNGEPTLHPQFSTIIDETIRLRNAYCPSTRIAVLSNATRIHIPEIFDALLKVDINIQKIDSTIPETIKLLNNPRADYDFDRTVEFLKKFNGKVVIQTLFLKGTINGIPIDNSTENEVEKWFNLIKEIAPRYVMIYSIARDTPIETLGKIDPERMSEIADKLRYNGISVQTTY